MVAFKAKALYNSSIKIIHENMSGVDEEHTKVH